MIYVAHPYITGNTNLTLREILVKVATFAYSAHLQKLILYHPVLMGENMLRWSGNLNRDEHQSYEFWGWHDERMIEVCEAFWVLSIDGWKDSEGVSKEILHANLLGKSTALIVDKGSCYHVKTCTFIPGKKIQCIEQEGGELEIKKKKCDWSKNDKLN